MFPWASPNPLVQPLRRVLVNRFDVLASSLAINLLTLALPLVILQVYDRIIPSHSTDTFAFMAFGLVLVVILDGLLRFLRTYAISWAGSYYEHETSQKAAQYVLGSEIQDFESFSPSVRLESFAAIESFRDHQSGQGLIGYTELPFAAIFIILIALIGGPLVVAPLVTCAIAAIFAFWLGHRLDLIIRQRNELDDERNNFTFQVFKGIHTIKGLGLEAMTCRKYQHLHMPISLVLEKVVFYSTLGQSIGAVLSSFSMVSVALLGSIYVIEGSLTGGSLMACTLLGGRAVQPLIRIIGIWVQYRSLKLSKERLEQLANIEHENNDQAHRDNTPEITGDIRFENASINQIRTGIPIFRNLNLHIKPGELVAILGQTGGGKSALLETVAGFIPVHEGKLYYDGADSREISYRKLRNNIGYARQNGHLFRGTLRKNLTKFRSRDYLPAAINIADRLGLSETIAAMPKGLETAVGESAYECLSDSDQQLVCLTMTFADNPKILLLDEANALLDVIAERRLLEHVKSLKGKSTVLFCTDRTSYLDIADRIFVVNKGELQEVAWDGFSAQPIQPTRETAQPHGEGL